MKTEIELILDRLDALTRENARLQFNQTVTRGPCPVTVELLLASVTTFDKINAIKAVRTLTGLRVKEAKDLVDRYWPNVWTFTEGPE